MWLWVKLTRCGLVMGNLPYQLDYICNQLESKRLSTPGKDFLDWIIWATPGGSPHKMTRKKEAFAFCLFVLALTAKFVYSVPGAFLCWYWNPVLQDASVDWRPAALQDVPGTLAPEWDAETSSLCGWTTTFLSGDSHWWLRYSYC